MVKKVCHLLITYGNKNQKYTSDLIEGLNLSSKDKHFVFCHHAYNKAENIKVVVSNVEKRKLKILFKFIRLYVGNVEFRELFKSIGFRDLKKWVWLIACNINVLHIHHEHAISTNVLSFFNKINVKVILSLRGRDLLLKANDIDKQKVLKSKLILVDHIHCISNFMKNNLLSVFNENGFVIYRGQPNPAKEHIKTSKNNEGNIRIICVGRLVWEKGHIYLIESIYRLKQLGYDIELDIYGDGDLKEFLGFRINQLNLGNEVHLKGFIKNENLKKRYKDYDIAVQPSLSEALSNGLIDFMMHNLPCVISNVGGMIEIIKNAKNGIVFDVNNMNTLDNAIIDAKGMDFRGVELFNRRHKLKFSSKQEISNLLQLYR